ncbi:MAG TPA: carbonic anhydrase [Anaerolineae bacterium]|nr:carbonic anhydrase [Anaerolineae bacterium]
MPTTKILNGMQGFQERFRADPERLVRLATEGQHPQVLMVACSDSRVAPELITGAELGDLFVVRTVGNLVPPYGTGEAAIGTAVEYAILHLHVQHVVLCGHTRCGCLAALESPPDSGREPHIARWIELARPAKTKAEASGLPPEELPMAVIRENVLLQMENLRSYDAVRHAERAGTITLHGWVYHLETGEVEAYDAGSGSWGALSAG